MEKPTLARPSLMQAAFPAAFALALVLATTLIHLPGLSGGFIFDDLSTIVDNPRVQIDAVDMSSLGRAAGSFDPGSALTGRPLAMVSFGINHALHGLDPWGYKLGGLIVHLVNVILVFALVRRVLRAAWPGASAGHAWATAAITAVWALHPLQISTTLYVVQRMETLSLTFVLAALICYLRGRSAQLAASRGWPWLTACAPLLMLGLASKESAVLFPAFALALELTVLRFGASSSATARFWRLGYGLAVTLAVLGFILLAAPHYWAEQHLTRDFGTYERLLTQLRVLPMYLGQILLPLPSSMPFYYDHIAPSRGWLEPATTLSGGLLLTVLLTSALALLRRAPLYALGILWFFAAHALTSNVVPLELAFEHRNYFALLGILLAVADIVRRIPLRDGPALKRAAMAAVIICLGFLAFIRASVWGNPFLLATELTSINPGSARASADLGAIYLEMTDGFPNSPFFDFALREFERGSLTPGSSIVSDQGLILTAAQAGREVPDIWWQRLIDKVRHGTLNPETTGALFGLLQNRYRNVPLDDARLTEAFLALFERVQMPAYSYAQFGDYLLTKAGEEDLATQAFVLAIERSAGHPDYARQVIRVLQENGHHHQAEQARARASALGFSLEEPSPPIEE